MLCTRPAQSREPLSSILSLDTVSSRANHWLGVSTGLYFLPTLMLPSSIELFFRGILEVTQEQICMGPRGIWLDVHTSMTGGQTAKHLDFQKSVRSPVKELACIL